MPTPSYATIVDEIRASADAYDVEALSASDLAYLKSLDLPDDVIAFYESHAPSAEVHVNDIYLLNVASMREEHERCEPGLTLRTQDCVVVMRTGGGEPYFLARVDDGYRIILGVDGQLGETKDETIANSSEGPSFDSFAKLLEAFAGSTLPSHG